jgi:dTMP kinase
VEIGLARKRRGQWNRFEDTHEAAFFERVRDAYQELARAEPERFRVIDGSGSVNEVDEIVQQTVQPLLDAGVR